MKIDRRKFAGTVLLSGLGVSGLKAAGLSLDQENVSTGKGSSKSFKISLNAYSFDKPLKAGTMTLENLLDFCAKSGFDGVDITGYYFPGYPGVPHDNIIFNIKRKAFRLGVELGCTGVRNDFTWPDREKRTAEKKLVKEWVIVAQKLGAPGVRIFSGNLSKDDTPWDEKAKWIADDIRECADFAGNHGVMLALQNHNDFLKTAEQTEKLLKLINHEWVGLMLDIGSYHTPDPYSDIADNAKYAVTWQMKEKIFVSDSQVDTDYFKIIDIVRKSGYRGYLPLETLGDGDPYAKVAALLKRVKSVMLS
ncbi:MAG TPA: sugar phosphate isomerase/epimerase family protein [Bacteroidales bacterium]|nr:sugar phosphate isomerase/epimerase family protein [Bacteroidales bacterium]